MAVFPKQEMDVFSLAHAMISGYQTNPGDFPNADLPALQAATEDLRQFLLGVVCFRAMAKIKTEDKDTAFDALVANMMTQLQQSEVDTASDPVKLEMIGWGKKTPTQPSNPPNQPRAIEAIMQGPRHRLSRLEDAHHRRQGRAGPRVCDLSPRTTARRRRIRQLGTSRHGARNAYAAFESIATPRN
jgi:hypothetical protein